MTNFVGFEAMCLVDESFDFQFTATDTGCLVPVYLSAPNRPIGKPHLSKSLSLPPTAATVEPSQPRDFPNSRARREGLRMSDFGNKLELHVRRSIHRVVRWLPSNDRVERPATAAIARRRARSPLRGRRAH